MEVFAKSFTLVLLCMLAAAIAGCDSQAAYPKHIDFLVSQFDTIQAIHKGLPIVMTGDFNTIIDNQVETISNHLPIYADIILN